MDALALHRLDEEEGNVFAPELVLEGVGIAERDAGEAGEERPEAVGELRAAVRRERAERQPVERVLDRDDPGPAGRRTPELDRRLDRLGAGAREDDASEGRGEVPQQLAGEVAGVGGDAELHRDRQVGRERVGERGADARVRATDVEHAEAADEVEEAHAVRVDEMGALAGRPRPVEADRPEHPHELRVDVLRIALDRAVERAGLLLRRPELFEARRLLHPPLRSPLGRRENPLRKRIGPP